MSRTVEAMSDVDLLGTLVGARTAAKMLQVASGSLATLLNESVANAALPPNGAAQVLAARELVRRALEESVRQGDVLSSPERVREFLRLMLAGRDHEVFMVLFLNSQNQVIAPEVMFRGTLTQTRRDNRVTRLPGFQTLSCRKQILASQVHRRDLLPLVSQLLTDR